MKPKPTSAAERTPVRVVFVTMDPHLASTTRRAQETLRRHYPGLQLTLHAASQTDTTRPPTFLMGSS